jgi:hypothetical protein
MIRASCNENNDKKDTHDMAFTGDGNKVNMGCGLICGSANDSTCEYHGSSSSMLKLEFVICMKREASIRHIRSSVT